LLHLVGSSYYFTYLLRFHIKITLHSQPSNHRLTQIRVLYSPLKPATVRQMPHGLKSVDFIISLTVGPVINSLLHKQYIYFNRVITWKCLKIFSSRTTSKSVQYWYHTSN